MYPLEVPDHFQAIAAEWHGGQASALYSVSSTGYIHDNGYRLQLEGELRRCRATPDTGEDVADFLAWVEALPVEDSDGE